MIALTYQTEQVSKLWPEAQPLLAQHYDEIAHYKDIELNPDHEAYDALERANAVRCFTVRDAGILVGYALFFVRPNLHYCQSLQAVQDVLYLAPEYRKGMTGVRLIRFSERVLKAQGVQVVYHHVKCTNRVGELLDLLGYELIDGVYGKRLN